MEKNSKTFNRKDLVITVNDIFPTVGKTIKEILEDMIIRAIEEAKTS